MVGTALLLSSILTPSHPSHSTFSPIPPARHALVHATVTERSGNVLIGHPVTFGAPFPAGEVENAGDLRLWVEGDTYRYTGTNKGRSLQVRPLVLWPDGTIRWALLDTQLSFGSRETLRIAVGFADDLPATEYSNLETHHPSLPEILWTPGEGSTGDAVAGLRSELTDRFGHLYVGRVNADDIEILEDGPLKSCYRVPGTHLPADNEGISSGFYQFTAYVRIFWNRNLMNIEWSLSNGPLLDPPGPLAFKDYSLLWDMPEQVPPTIVELPTGRYEEETTFALHQAGATPKDYHYTVNGSTPSLAGTLTNDLWCRTQGGNGTRWIHLENSAENFPSSMVASPGSPLRIGLLPAGEEEFWLDDASRKSFRLNISQARTYRDISQPIAASFRAPFVHLDPDDLAASLAWGDIGLFHAPSRAEIRRTVPPPKATMGWADWGEFFATNTHSTGSPRNRLSVFLEAVQSGQENLLDLAVARARHAMDLRPYHIDGFSADEYPLANLSEGTPHPNELSKNPLGRGKMGDRYPEYKTGIPKGGHGYNGFDREHMTLDDVYEYYLLSGSWLAKDALRSAGEAMLTWQGVVHSSRVIGWTLRALISCYRATGDPRYLQKAREIVHQTDEERSKGPVFYLRRMPPDPRHLPDNDYESPWMDAVAIYGMAAYWSESQDPIVPPMLTELSTFILSAYHGVEGFAGDVAVDDPSIQNPDRMPLGVSQWIPGALATAAFVTGDHAPVDAVLPYYAALRMHPKNPVRFGSPTWHWWQPLLVSLEQRHGRAAIDSPSLVINPGKRR